jgi:hypothetical protein
LRDLEPVRERLGQVRLAHHGQRSDRHITGPEENDKGLEDARRALLLGDGTM